MRRSFVCLTCLSALIWGIAVMAQSTKAKKNPPAQKEGFWQWALRFSGISANPNTLKGANDEPASGQVWIADLTSGTRRNITRDGGYRSPVFYPDSLTVLALKGDDVMRISSSGQVEKLYSIPGISKLVGFSVNDSSELLVLKQDGQGNVVPGELSIQTAKVDLFPYDPNSGEDRQMLEHLQSWQREYGTWVVYVKREGVQTLSGQLEIANVFLKVEGRDPENVSRCEMENCGQPSLSADKTHVLFIKAAL